MTKTLRNSTNVDIHLVPGAKGITVRNLTDQWLQIPQLGEEDSLIDGNWVTFTLPPHGAREITRAQLGDIEAYTTAHGHQPGWLTSGLARIEA